MNKEVDRPQQDFPIVTKLTIIRYGTYPCIRKNITVIVRQAMETAHPM